MKTRRGSGPVLALCLLQAACSGSGANAGFARDAGDEAKSDDADTFGDVTDAAPARCSDQATEFVFVLSTDNDLYRFAPDQKLFTRVGRVQCPTSLPPNSMAVDRTGAAWVNYVDDADSIGLLYRVDTANASCDAQPLMALPSGWERLGMGYSSDGPSTASETLFVATDRFIFETPYRLGRVDLQSKSVVPAGSFTPPYDWQDAELTGTGDGKLFAFFRQRQMTAQGLTVARIDKTSAAVQSPATIAGVEQPKDFAFAFWGGHFYLFTSQATGGGGGGNPGGDAGGFFDASPTQTTDVVDYDPATLTANPTYMTDIGFNVIGAGVSTCAPTAPPR